MNLGRGTLTDSFLRFDNLSKGDQSEALDRARNMIIDYIISGGQYFSGNIQKDINDQFAKLLSYDTQAKEIYLVDKYSNLIEKAAKQEVKSFWFTNSKTGVQSVIHLSS